MDNFNMYIFILEKFSNLNHLKRIYGYLVMIFRRFNLLEKREKGRMMMSCWHHPWRPNHGGDLAGDWMIGCEFGGHVHVEDDETNPMVLTNATNDDGWRPATKKRRRRRLARWRRLYGSRERTGEGANERGGLGGPIYSLGLKRSDSSRKKSLRENQNSVLEINSKTSLIRIKYPTICSDSWGKR